MSVIFGIVEEKSIIIAGDKRASSVDGVFISDNEQKVTEINEHLGIATAGNVAIEKAILKNVDNREDKEFMVIDDFIEVMQDFYDKVIENQCDSIFKLPFYCLVAGKGSDGRGHLVNAGKFINGFSAKEVSMALYPPNDLKQDICNQIFAKNYKLYHNQFCERTVREVAGLSRIVSTVGNKWIYDCKSEKGKIYNF